MRITDGDVDEFTTGMCGVLAVALHDATGWPIMLVVDEAGRTDEGLPWWVHAGVRTPEGGFLDVKGVNDFADVLSDWAWDADAWPVATWMVEVDVEEFRPHTLPRGRTPSRQTGRVRDLLLASCRLPVPAS